MQPPAQVQVSQKIGVLNNKFLEMGLRAGFRSQDSPDFVLATPQAPTAVEVRWPGGKVQRSEWLAGAWAVVISPEGLRRR